MHYKVYYKYFYNALYINVLRKVLPMFLGPQICILERFLKDHEIGVMAA